MVGNKTDLSELRQVTTEEGEQKAAQDSVMFLEASAKQGVNIKQLFKKIAVALPTLDEGDGKGDASGGSGSKGGGEYMSYCYISSFYCISCG